MRILILSISILLFLNQQSQAQCKEVSKALKAMNNKDIDSSISLLFQAEQIIVEDGLESVDEKCLAKYYYAKGAGFLIKGQREDSLAIKIEWFEKSANSYKKFIQLEEQPNEYEALVNSNMNSLGVELMNIGITYYEEQNYEKAHNYVGLGMELKRAVKPVEISEQEYFNALVCAKLAKEYSSAIIYADTLLLQNDLSLVKEAKYLTQKAEILVAMGQDSDALAVISVLEEKNPRDINPKLSKLQIYLDNQENDSALKVVNEITDIKPDRDDLWVLKAQLNYQKGNIEQGKLDFNKALEVNPENKTALYGLGVIYVNGGNKLVKLANDAADNEEADKITIQARKNFSLASAYLNRIIMIDSSNKQALTALRDIYVALKDVESLKIIEEKLKNVE